MTTYAVPKRLGPLPTGGAGFLTATTQTAKRTILQYGRTPQLLVMPIVTGVLFMVVFRYVLGGAIHTGVGHGYVDFLVPGFLAQTVMWSAMGVAAGVAEDSNSGVHDRLRSLPVPRAAPVIGRSLADLAINLPGLGVIAGLGFATGFRAHGSAGAVTAGFGLIALELYAAIWLFIAFGLVARNAQAAQGLAGVIVLPFAFVSAAFVPVNSMPSWLRAFAAHQPFTVVINAVRSLMLGGTGAAGVGHTTSYWVGFSLLWLAGIAVVSGGLAVFQFSRAR
ncbi:MAG TPA: ABC transporter permease [Gaiellaceae bacterium]|nr:ABC transporter permease [Gaiellaceae bacterium]